MSINSCTIDAFTINTLCGSRRHIIIDQLLQRGHPQHVNIATKTPLKTFRRDLDREVQPEPVNLTPHIEVQIQVQDEQWVQRIETSVVSPVVISIGAISISNKNGK